MNLFTGVMAAILVPLVAVVGFGVLWLAFRFKAVRARPVLFVILALAAAAAVTVGAAQISAAGGRPAKAQVVSKIDRLQWGRNALIPAVMHRLTILARLKEADGPETTINDIQIDVPGSRFDRLHEGDMVDVRVSAVGPFKTAHLAGGGTFLDLAPERSRGLIGLLAGLGGLAATGALILVFLGGRRAKAAAGAVIVLEAGLAALALHPYWESRPARAQAAVVSVRRVDQALVTTDFSSGHTQNVRLSQPYDEAELSLIPAPGQDPVRVIDRIDAGSAPVQAGQSVAVTFDPSAPREARMTGGRRTYGFRSTFTYALGPLAELAAGAAAFIGLLLFLRGRRARPKAASAKASDHA